MRSDSILDVIHCAPIPCFIGRTVACISGAEVRVDGSIEIIIDYVKNNGTTGRTTFLMPYVLEAFANKSWTWET